MGFHPGEDPESFRAQVRQVGENAGYRREQSYHPGVFGQSR